MLALQKVIALCFLLKVAEQWKETSVKLRDSERWSRRASGSLQFFLEIAKTVTSSGYRRISYATGIFRELSLQAGCACAFSILGAYASARDLCQDWAGFAFIFLGLVKACRFGRHTLSQASRAASVLPLVERFSEHRTNSVDRHGLHRK